MADKITIPTQGTGDTTPDVATENVGAKHYQLMKLASGAPGSAVTIEGGSGTSAAALRVVQASDSPLPAGSNSIGTVSAGLLAGTASIGSVNVLALPAIPAGTNSIGSVNVLALPTLPAGTNSIGSVNVLVLPTLPAGSNSIGTVSATLLAGTNTNEVVGDVAHDVAAAGNPLVIGGTAQDMDDTAPPNRTSAEARATRMAMCRDGAAFVHPHGPQIWSYHTNVSAALTDVSVHATPGAGLSLYVGTIIFSSGAATAINMFMEEGSTTVLGPYYLEAVAGRGMTVTFNPPKKITANTALTVTTSAAIAHSIDVTGFVGQG